MEQEAERFGSLSILSDANESTFRLAQHLRREVAVTESLDMKALQKLRRITTGECEQLIGPNII
jgi:hypothetical protein